MTRLLATTRTRIDESEALRMALLAGISFVLGLTFVALLIADEAHAAGV
jgi:hypothetical protein